jgi:hypothetical protein
MSLRCLTSVLARANSHNLVCVDKQIAAHWRAKKQRRSNNGLHGFSWPGTENLPSNLVGVVGIVSAWIREARQLP